MNPSKILSVLALAVAVAPVLADDGKISLLTAVHSKTMNGYHRTKNKDGTYKREYYALSNGGHVGGTMLDASIEKLAFSQITGVLSRFLAKENYHMAKDSKSADLLIVVHRGRTVPYQDAGYTTGISEFSNTLTSETFRIASESYDDIAAGKSADPSSAMNRATATSVMQDELLKLHMLNRQREVALEGNARLLGYIDDINLRNDSQIHSAAADSFKDLVSDLEEPRYYLFVFAYDFRAMTERKERKLLWATRVSIRAPGTAFDRDFAPMLAKAAKHFGQDSGGLLRRYDPRGRVDIGELEVLGVVPENAVSPPKNNPQ